MKLSNAITRGNNNFDILRLIAALMVIFGHSFALSPRKGEIDPILSFTGFDHSGSLAVKFFFFLSGLLVTNSLLSKRDVTEFATMRIARMVPALAICSVILALAIGPIFTTDPNYFSNPQVYRYIIGNSFIYMQYNLPGVFENLPFKSVNGSLWSIPYEACSYLAVAGLFLVGAIKNKYISSLICIAFILDSLLPSGGFFLYFANNNEIRYLPFAFALGALCAINKEHIDLTPKLCVGILILTYVFWHTVAQQALFYLSFFSTSMYISTLATVVRATPKWDISYGVYLYGWPAQQVIVSSLPSMPRYLDVSVTMGVTAFIACFSWILIEKPSLRFGRKILSRIQQSNAFVSGLNPYELPMQQSGQSKTASAAINSTTLS